MVTAVALVLLTIITRLASPTLQIWNFVPAGAIALYAGARLPKRWSWAVPVVAMILSDIALEYVHPWPYAQLTRWTVYLTLAATTFLGMVSKRPKTALLVPGLGVADDHDVVMVCKRPKTPLWVLPVLSLSASGLFFVTSNLATWAEGQLYPLTFQGLVQCYLAALPFLKNTILADLLGTALLFSLGPVFERAGRAYRVRSSEPSVELVRVDQDHVG